MAIKLSLKQLPKLKHSQDLRRGIASSAADVCIPDWDERLYVLTPCKLTALINAFSVITIERRPFIFRQSLTRVSEALRPDGPIQTGKHNNGSGGRGVSTRWCIAFITSQLISIKLQTKCFFKPQLTLIWVDERWVCPLSVKTNNFRWKMLTTNQGKAGKHCIVLYLTLYRNFQSSQEYFNKS